MKANEQKMCEDMTGCSQKGELKYYSTESKEGTLITKKEATELLQNGKEIAIPQAGAGNYTEVFTSLGFDDVKVVDWTSSAGDWAFGVKNEHGWFAAFQSHRYPFHGYIYTVNTDYGFFDTFDDLCKAMNMM